MHFISSVGSKDAKYTRHLDSILMAKIFIFCTVFQPVSLSDYKQNETKTLLLIAEHIHVSEVV